LELGTDEFTQFNVCLEVGALKIDDHGFEI
jgi:hypothetical protein